MSQDINHIVYSKNVVEFVAVAVQYCGFLEEFADDNSQKLVDWSSKILPLLYLKAAMLPDVDLLSDEDPEVTVTEDAYNYICMKLQDALGKDDAYLEVFVQEMKYSDTPIAASVSENLADIYQDLKNFISIYEHGVTETMNDALFACTEDFKTYWGQKLVNALRAVHALKYQPADDNEVDYTLNNLDLW